MSKKDKKVMTLFITDVSVEEDGSRVEFRLPEAERPDITVLVHFSV